MIDLSDSYKRRILMKYLWWYVRPKFTWRKYAYVIFECCGLYISWEQRYYRIGGLHLAWESYSGETEIERRFFTGYKQPERKRLKLDEPNAAELNSVANGECPKCHGSNIRKATLYWQCLTCFFEWIKERPDGESS